ncbi:MAG: hypothetical protein K2V38_12705 [Gemmataceae bacterium]|nr:hypothetical protein [Gemmataceae bacterium]
MRAAADRSPGDIGIVAVVVSGLLECGRPTAAGRVLAKARFLNPRNAELLALDGRLRFEAARLRQNAGGTRNTRNTRHAQDAQFARDGGRVLPFVRVADGTGFVRADRGSDPRPHFHLRLRTS